MDVGKPSSRTVDKRIDSFRPPEQAGIFCRLKND